MHAVQSGTLGPGIVQQVGGIQVQQQQQPHQPNIVLTMSGGGGGGQQSLMHPEMTGLTIASVPAGGGGNGPSPGPVDVKLSGASITRTAAADSTTNIGGSSVPMFGPGNGAAVQQHVSTHCSVYLSLQTQKVVFVSCFLAFCLYICRQQFHVVTFFTEHSKRITPV